MIRVGKREAPSSNQRATSTVTITSRLYLNTFRGEPAISRFAWHFTATHKSSPPFVTDVGSGLHGRIPPASPCSWVDHLVSGHLDATARPFGLAFATAPPVSGLTSRRLHTRRLILQKARRHPTKGLRPAGSTWFQDLFHSPHRGAFHLSLTVLVHYRSPGVFSLGSWATLLPTGFLVSGGTHAHDAPRCCPVTYGTLTLFGRLFQYRSPGTSPYGDGSAGPSHHRVQPRISSGSSLNTLIRFGLFPVRSPLLRESSLFLGVHEMFQFPRFPPPLDAVGHLLPGGVAPFGVRRIIGCQHLPNAFRRVATSFIGPRRLGIHHVLFSDDVIDSSGVSSSWCAR